MIPIRDNIVSREKPILVYTLIGLMVLIYFWDRGGGLSGPSIAFADLTFRPREVIKGFTSLGDPMAFAKIFTSMFLHGNLAHLVGNILFLWAFGPNVERAIGGMRFALYYLFWGILAAGAHIFVDPASMTPVLGASGAIGGVLGAYFLLFPGSRVSVVIPPLFFLPFQVASWVLLGGWFLFQIFLPQQGVANWAHAGGFLAGMLTILMLGGRKKVLAGREFRELEDDND